MISDAHLCMSCHVMSKSSGVRGRERSNVLFRPFGAAIHVYRSDFRKKNAKNNLKHILLHPKLKKMKISKSMIYALPNSCQKRSAALGQLKIAFPNLKISSFRVRISEEYVTPLWFRYFLAESTLTQLNFLILWADLVLTLTHLSQNWVKFWLTTHELSTTLVGRALYLWAYQ